MAIPDTVKLDAFIYMISLVMIIGKYMPLIVGTFAGLNLFAAVTSFVGGNMAFGVLNSILAFVGFVFLTQLFQRRNIHRYEYRYRGKKKTSLPDYEKRIVEAA